MEGGLEAPIAWYWVWFEDDNEGAIRDLRRALMIRQQQLPPDSESVITNMPRLMARRKRSINLALFWVCIFVINWSLYSNWCTMNFDFIISSCQSQVPLNWENQRRWNKIGKLNLIYHIFTPLSHGYHSLHKF